MRLDDASLHRLFLQIHNKPTRASVRQGVRTVCFQLGFAKLVLSKRVGELKINKALIQRCPMVAAEVLMPHTFLIDSYEVNKSDRGARVLDSFALSGTFVLHHYGDRTAQCRDMFRDIGYKTLYIVVTSAVSGTRCGVVAAGCRVGGNWTE